LHSAKNIDRPGAFPKREAGTGLQSLMNKALGVRHGLLDRHALRQVCHNGRRKCAARSVRIASCDAGQREPGHRVSFYEEIDRLCPLSVAALDDDGFAAKT
jgi:hypothetical protein